MPATRSRRYSRRSGAAGQSQLAENSANLICTSTTFSPPRPIDHEPGARPDPIPARKVRLLTMSISLFATLSLLLNQSAVDAQQQYMPSGSSARFFGGSKQPRGITLSVVKNISESTPVGEVLFNFKAEDKSAPNYNLT
jgi:hypothetical protein